MENKSIHQSNSPSYFYYYYSFDFQHIPRRLFNSNFICRAKNRFGTHEQSITIIEKSRYHTLSTSVQLSTSTGIKQI